MSITMVALVFYYTGGDLVKLVLREDLINKIDMGLVHIISFLLFFKVIEGPIDENTMIGIKQYKNMKVFGILKTAPTLVSAIAVFFYKGGYVEFLLLSLSLTTIAVSLYSWFQFYNLIRIHNLKLEGGLFYCRSVFVKLTKHGGPIWLMSLLTMFTGHFLILVTAHYRPLEDVALFTLALSIFGVVMMFPSMMEGFAVPKITELIKIQKHRIKEYVHQYYVLYFIVSSILIIGALLFSGYVVDLIGGEKYQNSKYILALLLLSIPIRTLSFYRNVLYVRDQSFLALKVTVVKNIIEIVGYFLMIPLFGLEGAIWVAMFSYLVYGLVLIRISDGLLLDKIVQDNQSASPSYIVYFGLVSALIMAVVSAPHITQDVVFIALDVVLVYLLYVLYSQRNLLVSLKKILNS